MSSLQEKKSSSREILQSFEISSETFVFMLENVLRIAKKQFSYRHYDEG